MKITHKLAALATAAVMMISVTGCGDLGELLSTFGKDDFSGTWVADYQPLNAAGTGARYTDGNFVTVVMDFDGSSENLLGSGKATFYQYKMRKSSSEVKADRSNVVMESFYTGYYALEDNSNYTKGNLVLKYMYGVQWNDHATEVTLGGKEYTLEQLAAIAMGDKTELAAAGDFKDGMDFFKTVITKTEKQNNPTGANPSLTYAAGKSQGDDEDEDDVTLYADIETFSFALGKAGSTSYCGMEAEEWYQVDQTMTEANATTGWIAPTGTVNRGTAKNKSKDGPFDKKYYSAAGCSWEVAKRGFSRITNKNSIEKAIQFINGEIKDVKGNDIDYVMNTITDLVDEEETEEDVYNVVSRSLADDVVVVPASEALTAKIGDYAVVEK